MRSDRDDLAEQTVGEFRWIQAVYGFDEDICHIAVPESGRGQLCRMAEDVLGTARLVVLYIPYGTLEVYERGELRGQVVGAVQLLAMPPARRIEDYWIRDINGEVRWPFGWPCRPVYIPRTDQCPELRGVIEVAYPGQGLHFFADYVRQLHCGPFRMPHPVIQALQRVINALGWEPLA